MSASTTTYAKPLILPLFCVLGVFCGFHLDTICSKSSIGTLRAPVNGTNDALNDSSHSPSQRCHLLRRNPVIRHLVGSSSNSANSSAWSGSSVTGLRGVETNVPPAESYSILGSKPFGISLATRLRCSSSPSLLSSSLMLTITPTGCACT